METIIQYDQMLFRWVHEAHQPFWDVVMPVLRSKYFWIPLYLGIIVWVIQNFKNKAIWIILGAILTIGLADTVSSKWIKPSVNRLRPCNDVEMRQDVKLLVPCGSGKSFTSSHATNHFAIASFFFIVFSLKRKKWLWLFFFWAALISFGQVYVGVHYPIDVLCGGLIGMLIGWSVGKLTTKLSVSSISDS